MTFNDIFKSSFLTRATESFSLVDTVLTACLALLLGLVIYAIYKKTYNSVLYSRSFNISLLGLTVISSILIMAVTSDVVLSLGMVGALSIVRFRTAIKDPMDLVYLFWAIAVGIITGSQQYILAVVGTLIMAVVLLVLANRRIADCPYLLLLQYTTLDAENAALELVKKEFARYNIKSKTVRPDGTVELSLELRMKHQQTAFVNQLSSLPGMANAALVSYNGEFAV